MFSSVLGGLMGKKQQIAHEDVDEQDLVQQHQNFFGGGNSSNATSGAMGSAAAMQALKMFTGGQGTAQASTGAGGAQNAFVGMAMGEAAKLFDQQQAQGNTSSSKNEVVAQAGKVALQMFMKSEMGGSGGGLMSLASKFM